MFGINRINYSVILTQRQKVYSSLEKSATFYIKDHIYIKCWRMCGSFPRGKMGSGRDFWTQRALWTMTQNFGCLLFSQNWSQVYSILKVTPPALRQIYCFVPCSPMSQCFHIQFTHSLHVLHRDNSMISRVVHSSNSHCWFSPPNHLRRRLNKYLHVWSLQDLLFALP